MKPLKNKSLKAGLAVDTLADDNNKISVSCSSFMAMVKNAVHSFPEECCGFIFGDIRKDACAVTATMKVDNAAVKNRHRAFLVAPENYMAVERFAEQNGLTLMGVYHSHPNQPAFPSETDKQFAIPGFYYIIMSVTRDETVSMTCWQFDDNKQIKEQSSLYIS